MTQEDFSNIGYEDFRRLAKDESLSKYQRIGFPDSYRSGHEEAIFADICRKVTNLRWNGQVVVDIGPGCSDLPRMLIRQCEARQCVLTLVDSEEMLAMLPDAPSITKVVGPFPSSAEDALAGLEGRADAIICYSVLHYVLVDVAFFRFVDSALALLAPGGQLLIGDVPNVSKRKRFFASEAGVRFHQSFMKTDQRPDVRFNCVEHDQIDDAVVFAILQRARAAGFDAYVMPQAVELPMANRREDILIVRP